MIFDVMFYLCGMALYVVVYMRTVASGAAASKLRTFATYYFHTRPMAMTRILIGWRGREWREKETFSSTLVLGFIVGTKTFSHNASTSRND